MVILYFIIKDFSFLQRYKKNVKFNKINSSIIHLSSKKASFQITILVFRTDIAGLTKKPDSDFGCLALWFLYIIYKV